MIHILLVDDHPTVVAGIEHQMESEPNIRVTATLCPLEALDLVRREPFDVMLFDLKMKKMDGIELTRQVLQIRPDSRVLMMSGLDLEPYMNLMLDAGVSGWIRKEATQPEMFDAIYHLVDGYTVIPTSMFRQMRRATASVGDGVDLGSLLSDRELTLLLAISQGKKNREIADEMHLVERSVEKALTKIYKKLKVSSKTEAAQLAQRQGLMNHDEVR